MPPFGIGADLAPFDGSDLAAAIATRSGLDQAVSAYEAKMPPRAEAAARVCAELVEGLAGEAAVDAGGVRGAHNDGMRRAG